MSGYDEAVAWFRADRGRVRDLDDVDNRSAAIAIVNAVLAGAVPAGRDLTAGDVQDAMDVMLSTESLPERRLRDAAAFLNRIVRPSGGEQRIPTAAEIVDEYEASQRPDPSPRSWSLPAPPPDDVTVVHVPAVGIVFYRDGDRWVDEDRGDIGWSEVLDMGTVVEGEPPAPEPPRFERGFYRLARDLDTEHGVIRERLVFAAYLDTVDEVWRVFCESGDAWVSAAALAAAGAVRVEDDK